MAANANFEPVEFPESEIYCFEPVSVPLSFTLDLELLDRQRVNR